MTDYALNDRGSLEIVTEDFYDAEIMRLFEGLRYDREQVFDGQAHLVPETDNPHSPRSIAVWVGDLKVGRMDAEASRRYWPAIARVVASGYEPVVPVRLRATMRKQGGQAYLESVGTLSVSRPALLFPLNSSPVHAALLPQGPSIKVLDEKEHAEYLHQVLPVSGEGRVILTLEANQLRSADGTETDSVDVLHERRVVGRLSTQMSQQFVPVIREAFRREKLTAVWGTIRGNAYELSLTIQAPRASDIPAAWKRELPNGLPALQPEAAEYEIEPMYVPSNAESHPENRRRLPRGVASEVPETPAVAEESRGSRHRNRPARSRPAGFWGWSLGLVGLVVLVLGLIGLTVRPALGILGILLGASLAFMGLYVAMIQPQDASPDYDYVDADGDAEFAGEDQDREGWAEEDAEPEEPALDESSASAPTEGTPAPVTKTAETVPDGRGA